MDRSSSPSGEWTSAPRALRARVRAARRSARLRYGMALAAVAAAIPSTALVRGDVLNDQSFLIIAVFIAAWIGGLGPGLLATVLGTAAANYFFVAPENTVGGVGAEDVFRLTVLATIAVSVGYLAGTQQRALARAQALAGQSEAAADQLRAQAAALERTNRELAATAAAAQTAREEYHRLIETANEGVWIIDTLGNTTYANARMAAMLGYTPEEMAGRSIFDFMDDVERPRGELALAMRNRGLPGDRDVRYKRKDGSDLWTRAITNPIRDASGRVTGALGMFTDITERRRAERRLAFLADASATLAGSLDYALTLDAVAKLAVDELADSCAIDLLDPGGDAVARVAVRSRSPEQAERFAAIVRRYPVRLDEPSGPARAIRTGESELEPDLDPTKVDAVARDATHREQLHALDLRSVIVAPLVAAGRTIGAMTLVRHGAATVGDAQPPFDEADRALAEELARRAALAVDNARLYDAARAAREAAERAAARTQFLSDASVLLSSSLREEDALNAVTRLAVPLLADWCAVDVQDDAGSIRRVGVAHTDPVMVDVARALERAGPLRPDAAYGPGRVIRTGATVAILDTAPGAADDARHEGRSRVARSFGLRSYICAPLVARGRTLGALTLATSESGRVFGADDVALAEDIARRTAVALDNARLYREAQAANKAKSDFLATMSHELRTPLNAIGGYAQLMEMGLRGPVTPEQRQDLVRIQRSQHHLLSLVEDVLSFAKIEAARVQYDVRACRVGELLGDLEVLVAPQLQAKELELVQQPYDDAVAVLADPERARQVIVNLLSNAIKFTAPGGRVTLACEPTGDAVHVHVQDTGIGIPATQLEAIFEPFTQVSSGLTRPAGGTGLGLAISRELARAMGGELTVVSEVGQGSRFTLALRRG